MPPEDGQEIRERCKAERTYPLDAYRCTLPQGHDGPHKDNLGRWTRSPFSNPSNPDPTR